MNAKEALAWAKQKQQQGAAMSRSPRPTDTLPEGMAEGTVRHPFAVTDRDAYREMTRGKGISQRTHKAPIVEVALAELTGIQRTVNRERLSQHFSNPELIPSGALGSGHGGLVDKPVVVRMKGKMYVHDGHHRAVAAHLRGQSTIEARLIDLDGGE